MKTWNIVAIIFTACILLFLWNYFGNDKGNMQEVKPDVSSESASNVSPEPQKEQASDINNYTNKDYKVSLKYPPEWRANSSERYEGKDGFFQIGAVNGEGMTIDEVAELDANHKLLPYGSEPKIESIKINGQEARLILPSEDQPDEMKGQAEIIIKYPSPVTIGSGIYSYFVLWADKEHIKSIGDTIKFVD